MNATMELPATKRCTKCGEVKQMELFRRSKNKKDGRRNDCKSCCAVYDKEWAAANPEKTKKNKERYEEVHKDKQNTRKAKWKADNKEWVKAWWETYYQENKAHIKQKNHKWRLRNLDRENKNSRERSAIWRANNPEKQIACNRAWREKNPGYSEIRRLRDKAVRDFFKMHRAMHAIAETLNQMKP